MKGAEELPEQTARGLFELVFDEQGIEVPSDDLAPAAVAGYRRYRRRRTALAGAAGSAALVLGAMGALAIGDRWGGSGSDATPAVLVTSAQPGASSSAPGSNGSRIVDCYSNLDTGSLSFDRARHDCQRAKALWQAVFPGATVAGDRDVTLSQLITAYASRVPVATALKKGDYGTPHPEIAQDFQRVWQDEADAGRQTWSGFKIPTQTGVLQVSAQYIGGAVSEECIPGQCERIALADGTTAQVSGSAAGNGFRVWVPGSRGGAYQFVFASEFRPRIIEENCESGATWCYIDLSDGSIHRGHPPASPTVPWQPAITRDGLLGVLKRPAFADLVKAFFTEGLGHS